MLRILGCLLRQGHLLATMGMSTAWRDENLSKVDVALERRVECKNWCSENIQARVGKYLLHFMFDMAHPLRVKQCQICARGDSDLEYQHSRISGLSLPASFIRCLLWLVCWWWRSVGSDDRWRLSSIACSASQLIPALRRGRGTTSDICAWRIP